MFQFSGPFSPLPAETTVSASAIEILLVALSIFSTVISDAIMLGEKDSVCGETACSTSPKALLESPIILTSVAISVSQKALLLNTLLFTRLFLFSCFSLSPKRVLFELSIHVSIPVNFYPHKNRFFK